MAGRKASAIKVLRKQLQLCLVGPCHLLKKTGEGLLVEYVALNDLTRIHFNEDGFFRKPAADSILTPTHDFRFDLSRFPRGKIGAIFLESHHDPGAGLPTLIRGEIQSALAYVCDLTGQRRPARPAICNEILCRKSRRIATICIFLDFRKEPKEKTLLQAAFRGRDDRF